MQARTHVSLFKSLLIDDTQIISYFTVTIIPENACERELMHDKLQLGEKNTLLADY